MSEGTRWGGERPHGKNSLPLSELSERGTRQSKKAALCPISRGRLLSGNQVCMRSETNGSRLPASTRLCQENEVKPRWVTVQVPIKSSTLLHCLSLPARSLPAPKTGLNERITACLFQKSQWLKVSQFLDAQFETL